MAERTHTTFQVASILSARTSCGMVEIILNDTRAQLDLDKAREIVGMLQGAIEAAVSDELMFKFLTGKIGLSQDAAAAALLDLRELRQGSRSTVWPQ